MKKLEKKYNFTESEKKWQKYWQDNKIFKFDWNDKKRENIYSIDTPPPHVSGALHMGHIFGYTQMDLIARFQRMNGKNVFYPFGFDDNGLPSERYVEKKIGKKSKTMDRHEFVRICDKEIREAELFMKGNAIEANYSFDFDEEYRTISPTSRKVSQMSFIDLYDKGVLERKEEPVIWDVVDQTALAQTEAEDAEAESQMNYLIFGLSSPSTLRGRGQGLGAVSSRNYFEKTLENAKKSRQKDNFPEKFLWEFLRNKNLEGLKFKREAPIDKYIVDFVCFEKKVVIEIDGNIHNLSEVKMNDIERQNNIEKLGYKFLRIKAKDVVENIFDVLKEIVAFISLTPNPRPLPLKGEGESLVIMTTRPELLPACVAIFAHPDDREKYKDKVAITPLGVEIPILFDESVEKEKGTGVMMCCTFGDNADVEKYKKYNLPLKIIINEKGCLYFENVVIDEKYKSRLDGLFTTKAREEIINILEEEGKIAKAPEKIIHTVKVGERSKSPLEIIVKKQWNIKVLDIKDELHKKASEVKWFPAWMENRMHSWIDGLNWNWCISRQRFFGVPVPCWYSKRKGEEGRVILPNIEDLPVDPTFDLPKGYSADEVAGESDVFDTWMTSSVSPQLSTQGFSEKLCCDRERFKTLNIPFDLRAQGHDIIRTWAFCTLVKSHYHENKVPWKNIFVNGFCLATDGTKMSKSVGNVIDPIKAMKEFGTDAVRYWASNGAVGVDINYSVDMIKTGQKLITKLFNSAKFAEMNFENLSSGITPPLSGSQTDEGGLVGGTSYNRKHSSKALYNAQNLRHNTTEPEKILWYYLKNKQLEGIKFRRQQPIDKYIVDFVCCEKKVVVELDGGQHNDDNTIKYDNERKEFLKQNGYIVLRFWNNDVMNNIWGVLDTIYDSCFAPHQNSVGVLTPPQGGSDSSLQHSITNTIDKWLLSKIKTTIEKSTQYFENYEYSKALETAENFFWNDFCDNYLEIVKVRCYGANGLKYQNVELTPEEKEKIDIGQKSAILTIYYVFNAILKLFAPFIPAICDEIYSCLYEEEFNKTKSIANRGNWAKSDIFVKNDESELIGEESLKIIAEVRKYKSEKNISIKEIIEIIEINSNIADKLENIVEDLKNVCNVNNIRFVNSKEFSIKF